MFRFSRSVVPILVLIVTASTMILGGCGGGNAPSSNEQIPQATIVFVQTQLARYSEETLAAQNPSASPTILINVPTSQPTTQSVEPTKLPTTQEVPPTDIPEGQPTPTQEQIEIPTATTTPLPPTATATALPTRPLDTPPDVTSIYSPNPGAESDHPYENKTEKQWILSGTDPKAGATRLHFSQIELEDGVDWLVISDGKDAEIQRFTGSYPTGLWTEPVPGSIVKLRLVTDGSVQLWGFKVDSIADAQYKTLGYSSHPYPHYADFKLQFNNLDPGAQGTRLHFSRIDLEPNVDWIVVMDLTESAYQWITGHYPDGLWTNGVPGNGVIVKLYSDGSVNDWGFNLDALESAAPEPTTQKPESNQSLAESAHPNRDERTWTLINPDPAATFTKVHFARLEILAGYYDNDYLDLLDGSDNQIQSLRGVTASDFWSDDIPGRVVKIKSGRGGGWGFRIDQLANGAAK